MRLSLLGALAMLALSMHAAVSLVQEDHAGKPAYRLANDRVSLLIVPALGGAVISYVDKLGGNVDLVAPRGPRGLCIDHFQSQVWPGELLGAAYEVTDHRSDPQAAVLALRCPVTGQWQGNEEPRIKDLVLEKTYTLRADSPALECRIRITAPKKDAKLFAYWQQHILFAGGQYDRATDKSFRPSTRGVRVKAADNWGATGVEDFLRDFNAGWIALLDTERKNGIVVLSDYNELDALYACGGNVTIEPMYRTTYLPAGQSVEYATWVVPVVGLDNVVAATPDYVAGYHLRSDGAGAGEVALSAIRSVNAPAPLTMQVALKNVQQPALVTAVGAMDFGTPGAEPQTRKLPFANAGGDPLVLQVTTAAGTFEEYCNGGYSWGENITVDMATPVYRGERPKQYLTLAKPSPLKLKPAQGTQVWYAAGLLDGAYQLTPAVQMSFFGNNDIDRLDRVFTSHSANWQTRLSAFPYDYDQLLAYDVVVLGGVKGESLGNIGQEMLGDYVAAGGGLIVLGGPAAYGAARLRGTPLADLLPVTVADTPFDLETLADPVLRPTPEGVALLEDCDWSAPPRVRHLHRVEVKPWGRVLVEADGRPFLVVGETGPGQARVVCILGAAMSMAEDNADPFWEWRDWKYLMRQLVWWTMKDNVRFPPPS